MVCTHPACAWIFRARLHFGTPGTLRPTRRIWPATLSALAVPLDVAARTPAPDGAAGQTVSILERLTFDVGAWIPAATGLACILALAALFVAWFATRLGRTAPSPRDTEQAGPGPLFTASPASIAAHRRRETILAVPDRSRIEESLREAIDRCAVDGTRFGVLLVDLDRFRTINTSLGHAAGDELLLDASRRLLACIPEQDRLLRRGGDEFIVVLHGVDTVEDVERFARRIRDHFERPFALRGHDVRVTASIGIALYPNDGPQADQLLRSAEAAMYRAKDGGRNRWQCFTPAMDRYAMEKLTLEADLRDACARGEIGLRYQPQVDLVTRRIVGIEALVRWRHPRLGELPPARFIPLAEECGLIVPLGERVLHMACAQRSEWRRAGFDGFPIAVNVSPLQLRDPGFERAVARTLFETALDPALLDLELTETALVQPGEQTAGTLIRLQALGIGISIDDFGTGYSSLAYLKRFPIGCLKIDRCFVRDLLSDPQDAAIVQAIVGLARSLNLRVVAEGVETTAQASALAAHGCGQCQGYLLGRPMDADSIREMLGTFRLQDAVPAPLPPIEPQPRLRLVPGGRS